MEKYKRIKMVGKGTFGQAVLVQSVENPQKLFVMKVIDASSLNQKQKEEAINEVHVLKAMRHPYIITYRESFIEKRCLCIVMDYADGGDLNSMILQQKQKGQYFREDQILDWFAQMALALKHIHDRKILHRDLKTQNIFLTKKGEIKLGDFGIARILQSTDDCAKTIIGTPYYLSPEICQEKPYNQRSDIWSLGCILYELTMLRRPFEGDSLRNLVKNILYGTYPPVAQHFSENLRKLIAEMLTKDPAQRPSIKQILNKEFLSERIGRLLKTTLANYQNQNENDVPNNSNKATFLPKTEGDEAFNVSKPKTPIAIKKLNLDLRAKCSKSSERIRSQISIEKAQNSERSLVEQGQIIKKPMSARNNSENKPPYPLENVGGKSTGDNVEFRRSVNMVLVNKTKTKLQTPELKESPIDQKYSSQPNIDYIIHQNLSLIKQMGYVKDLVPPISKEFNIPSPASHKSQFQIITNNLKVFKSTEELSALNSARRDETQPETESSTRKFKDSLIKESPRSTLDDTCVADGQRFDALDSNRDKGFSMRTIRASLENYLGTEKFQRIYSYLKANRGKSIEVKALIKIVGEVNNECLINFQKLINIEEQNFSA